MIAERPLLDGGLLALGLVLPALGREATAEPVAALGIARGGPAER